MSLKAKIEAVLFLTDKPIRAQAIARIINEDVQNVRKALIELIHDYEEREGGLEIADEDGYSFQVKEQYASLMDEFLPVELSAALVRTLSAIAIKQPIMQSEIIRVRGAGAYEHIRELVNRDLVAKKEDAGGRSPLLSTTKKFQEYFRLTQDGKSLRNFLKKKVKAAEASAAAADAAAEEKQLAIQVEGMDLAADQQLNDRIYLETQTGSGDDEGSDENADNAVETETTVMAETAATATAEMTETTATAETEVTPTDETEAESMGDDVDDDEDEEDEPEIEIIPKQVTSVEPTADEAEDMPFEPPSSTPTLS
jgi:segregation and condensation protein B